MKKIFRKMVVLMLFLSYIGLIGGASSIYAKSGINNKNIVLSDKYTGKKLDRIQNSIKGKKEYRFLIESSDSFDSISSYFKTGDKKAKVKRVADNKYMVRLPLNTNFLNEELTQINNGIIPLNIGGYNVIQPEIVELSGTGILTGEQTEKLWGQTKIGADIFQEELQTKEKIKVAILDTGIDYNQTDLDNNYDTTLSYDFINDDNDALDDNDHGTQVAGIIGSEVNGTGTYGVNSNTDLVALKVLDANGLGTTYDILEAIDYAKINNIKVVNMSFGGIGDASTSAVCQAITDAKVNGIYTVVSAGNNNTDITNLVPASCSDSITVGVIDSQNNKASFSNYGTGVMLYAAGVDIYSTSLNNTYSTVSGTSFSAPFVTGLVAKELAFSGGISYSGVVNNLLNNYGLYYNFVTSGSVTSGEVIYGSGELENPIVLKTSISNEYTFTPDAIGLGWNGYVTSNGGYYRSVPMSTYIKNGRAYIPPSAAGTSYYWTNFELNALGDLGIEGDDIRIDTMIKSSLSEGAIQARDPCITLYGEYNAATLCYMGDSWGQPWTYLGAGAQYISNTPLLIKNFENWHVSSLGIKNNEVSAYYDYNKSAGVNFIGKIGKIQKIRFMFKGSASMDWLKIYVGDSVLALHEDFNVNGASNIKTYDLCGFDVKYCQALPAPTNLKQFVQSPELEPKEINSGEKIGKYQSGSGMILSADMVNNTNHLGKLIFDIYKDNNLLPIYSKESGYFGSGSTGVTLPYLGAGNYRWTVKSELQGGKQSEAVNFGTNNLWETDYSLFEGFEPYPFGYKFYNTGPAEGSLTGGLDYYFNPIDKSIYRLKNNGNKWELFHSAFDTTELENNQKKLFDAFETVFNDNSLQIGSCYGMSISAIMANKHPDYINNFNSNYLNILGNGTVFDLPKPLYNENKWTESDNDILNTIYSMQLSFKSKAIQDLANNSTGTIDEIYTTLKEYPENTYIMIFGNDSSTHAVVPYRIEDNGISKKIYYWDNIVPYPNYEDEISYNQYIQIDADGTWKSDTWIDEMGNFDLIGLIDIEDIYMKGKSSAPIGFNGVDYLYILKGKSDIIVTDTQGRVSGYINGEIKKEIPGVKVVYQLNSTSSGITENTSKQIYLPQKQDGLTVNVISKTSESYDLIVAGGDYYTKVENVEASTGQIDSFNISRENLKIDFDDTKSNTGTYNLLVDDFQNNGTGTVYIDSIISTPNPQQYSISWTGVLDNANDSVKYEIDTDNDGIYDKTTNLPPIFQDLITPTTTNSFSGTLTSGYSTGSYIETININLNAIDNENGSGIDKTFYAIGTNTGTLEYTSYSGSIIVNGLGDYTLNYYSIDKFGNVEENKTINFTLTERPETYNGVISGYVYDDENNNGIQETEEKLMAGWKVCIDKNNDNTCQENTEPFILTNNDGYYELNGLAKGLYKIIEIPHTNWNITSPTSLYYDVNLGIGQIVTNMNFGNYRIKGGKK